MEDLLDIECALADKCTRCNGWGRKKRLKDKDIFCVCCGGSGLRRTWLPDDRFYPMLIYTADALYLKPRFKALWMS